MDNYADFYNPDLGLEVDLDSNPVQQQDAMHIDVSEEANLVTGNWVWGLLSPGNSQQPYTDPPFAPGYDTQNPRIPAATASHPAPKVAIPRSANTSSSSRRRIRSSRACEPCRQRKIKCEGNRPVCRQCAENQIGCVYLDVKRVREQKELEILTRRVGVYERFLREVEPEVEAGIARRIRRVLKVEEDGSESESDLSNGSLEAIDLVEEDLNRNEKTRATGFIGKNSEVSWMQKLESEAKHRSHRTDASPQRERSESYSDTDPNTDADASITQMSYHLDDLSFPMFDLVDPYVVPPREQADRFLTAYMQAFHPSFNVIREKTFRTQYRQFYRQSEAIKPPRKWLGVLNMVFAIGCYYCRLTHEAVDGDGDKFMARARKLCLGDNALFEHSDLQQVQVEFLIAFYLLARGHINRASKFSNMAFRSALSLGINLRFVDQRTHHSAKEARSRLWWSIFGLEHSIAALTGRASCASEGLSSVPMPIPYEEESFNNSNIQPLFRDGKLRKMVLRPTLLESDEEARGHAEWLQKSPPEASPSLFFYCVVDLVFIMQAVITKVYSIEGIRERSSQIEQRIRNYAMKLENWLAKVPAVYRFEPGPGSEPQPASEAYYEREKFALAMHFYSAKITLYRPCLTHTNPPVSTTTSSPTEHSHTRTRNRTRTTMSLSCLHAACAVISLLPTEPDVISLSRLSPWWLHLHYIMQATAALLLGLTRWPSLEPGEEYHGTQASPNPNPNPNPNASPDPAPVHTLKVATVVSSAKKALWWLYTMAADGDEAARRAFTFCDGFMRRIAPSVGVDVGDLPEAKGLPELLKRV